MKIIFSSKKLSRNLYVLLVGVGLLLGGYAIVKGDETMIGSERSFPLANHTTEIAGAISSDGMYTLEVEVPLDPREASSHMMVEQPIICDLVVIVNENGVVTERSEIKEFSKMAVTFVRKLDFFTSDRTWMLKQGTVKMAISRRNRCDDDRVKAATLKLRRVVGSPTERFLLRHFEFLAGAIMIILGVVGLISIKRG